MKPNKKTNKVIEDDSTWHGNERSKRPKKSKNETIDLVENINEIENSIEDKIIEVNSAKASQLVKKNLKITKIENSIIKNEIKMEPLQIIVPKEDYYNIKRFKVFYECYFFDYINDFNIEVRVEVRDITTIRWIYSVNNFLIKKKTLEEMRQNILGCWLRIFKNQHINHDFEDLNVKPEKIFTKEELDDNLMSSNEFSLNSNKLFK